MSFLCAWFLPWGQNRLWSGFLGAGDGRAGSVAQVAHRVREEHSLRRGSVILELVPKLFWFLRPGTLTSGGDGPVHMGAGTPGDVLWEALCGPSGCRMQSCGVCDLPPCRCRPVRAGGGSPRGGARAARLLFRRPHPVLCQRSAPPEHLGGRASSVARQRETHSVYFSSRVTVTARDRGCVYNIFF